MTSDHPLPADLRTSPELVMAELRPPRKGLVGTESIDTWIDTFHAVRRLTRANRYVLLTDGAVGSTEEENLAHLEGNLADEADPARVIPFLTCNHTLDYCLLFAERAWARGFRSLTVVGGDTGGTARCVPHSRDLRALIRERVPGLALGGWVNPHADPGQQATWLAEAAEHTDYYLTQVVSHHSLGEVEALQGEIDRLDLQIPGVFGVFYYWNADPRALARFAEFFPVPKEGLSREFSEGAQAEEVCARSLRALGSLGIRHLYVSNLGVRGAAARLDSVLLRARGGPATRSTQRGAHQGG